MPAVIRADGLTSSAVCGQRVSQDTVGACCGAWKRGEEERRALFPGMAALAGAVASFLKKDIAEHAGRRQCPNYQSWLRVEKKISKLLQLLVDTSRPLSAILKKYAILKLHIW